MINSFYKQSSSVNSLTDLINQELENRDVKPSRVISINTEANRANATWSATVFYYTT
jgi:hypothetical protein